ncbi:MAG: response regulator [bacterium]|nr:response regulator [bacterium]
MYKRQIIHYLVSAIIVLFSCLFVFNPYPLDAREATGFKYIQNYSTGLHPLNWSIVRDKRGVIYVANNAAVLEWDGVSMRYINIPNWWVRSLAIDDNDTVYVGGVNELGYLAPDANGMRHYISLLGHLDQSQKNFSNVWRIRIAKGAVYFWMSKFLFRWDPETKKMDSWQAEINFNGLFTCNGRLFVHQRNAGLMEMIDGAMKIVEGTEILTPAKIRMMAPYGSSSQKILIGTLLKGLYIYDGKDTVPFPTEADDYLKKNHFYHGACLRSSAAGEFALATQNGGLVVIDEKGKLKHIFDKTSGLQDDNVKYVYEDSRGNLWLALDKGISKIEYASPISFYNDRLANLSGNVFSVAGRGTRQDLLVGTSRGLYALTSPDSPGSPGGFRPVPGIPPTCWALLPLEDSLLVAATGGVFQVDKELRAGRKVTDTASYVFYRFPRVPDRVLVGTREGLAVLGRENGRWTEAFRFKNITHQLRTIVEDKNSGLWLGTLANGVLKVDFPAPGNIRHPVVTHYSQSHGLPGGEVRVFRAAAHVIFAAGRKIYRFDEKNRTFIPDPILGTGYTDGSASVFTLVEDKGKNIWFHSEFRNFRAAPQANGTFAIHHRPFLRIPISQVNSIYPGPNGDIVWFGGSDGLFRYDTRVKKNYHRDFSAIIREVIVNGSYLMFDEEISRYKSGQTRQGGLPVIPYRDRNITFRFAAPFGEAETSNTYRWLLEGYDERWSEWSSESRAVYTNLDSGRYTFRVQGKNVYNHLSREARFPVKVLPPWTKTWWAFSLYALAALTAVFLVVKWRSRKLEREKKWLEHTVQERTTEIYHKNRQLENQTRQLTEQSGQLKEMDRIKSRFFTNISHEFRTPLTLITGPLEQMLENENQEEEKKKLHMMLRNSRRLLDLINQLLDLSKLDGGKMKLQAAPRPIVPFIKEITASFELLAHQNRLQLTFHGDEEMETPPIYLDTAKMEVVMCNLLVNAVKFTPPNGKITVSVRTNQNPPGGNGDINGPDGVEISVSDTGTGIPGHRLAHIFDRFYQVEESLPGSHGGSEFQGTGIGLALTRELVLRHHGSIDVHSSTGEESGTEFIIQLPGGSRHLEPGEIVDKSIPVEKRTDTTPFNIPGDINETGTAPEQEQDARDTRLELEAGAGAEAREIILVVEDNADARQFIRGALEQFYIIKEAVDGDDGIQQARIIIPDLVVSDIMMPGTDGYGLCNELKKDIKTSHIPIILLTAKAAEESIVQGLETGADDYVTKPFSTRILLARIKNLIQLRRQWQEKLQRGMLLQPAEVRVSSMDEIFIKEVQEVIEKNLSDVLFSVDQLGKKLYMSRATIYRKILALTGEPPREFIKTYRLKRGAQLLKANFGSVLEVALEVGFSSTSYFSKCFKKKFNQIPSEFGG